METQGRLIVDVARLAKGGEWFRGEPAADLLELGESEFVTPEGGMRYALKVEIIGTELLALFSITVDAFRIAGGIVLLALLYLGIKNIHLGPTLPGFLSPNVAKVLVEKFGIAGVGTVEDDIDLFLNA